FSYLLSTFLSSSFLFFFFFFNYPATTVIYTLSLHDALPIFSDIDQFMRKFIQRATDFLGFRRSFVGLLEDGKLSVRWSFIEGKQDRKSTRLNSSHRTISYAVFCLKKKKKKKK